MSHKSYFFSLFISFILSFGIWLLILYNYNPYKSDLITIGTFFASLYLWIFSLLAIIGFYFRVWLVNKEVIYANLRVSLRQAALFSFILVGLFFLQTLRVLNLWDGIMLVLAILLLELFFRARTA